MKSHAFASGQALKVERKRVVVVCVRVRIDGRPLRLALRRQRRLVAARAETIRKAHLVFFFFSFFF